MSTLYISEVEELRRDKSPGEIRVGIAALEGKREKSSYDMKLLARFYWADDKFLEAGKTYEEAVRMAEQNSSLSGVAESIAEELKALKATGMYSDAASAIPVEMPAAQKQPLPGFVKPMIIGFSAFAVVMIAVVVVLIMMLGKNSTPAAAQPDETITATAAQSVETSAAAAAQTVETSVPATNESRMSAQEVTTAPVTNAPAENTVTKESLEFVCSEIYNWEQEQYNKKMSEMMFGNEYYVMFYSYEVNKPEIFGFVRYTIKDESYVNDTYGKEVCLAVLYLSGKGDEKNPPDRHECYLAVQVEFEQDKVRIVNPKEPTMYSAPKLNELYDKLDSQYSIYNKALTEF